MNRGGFDSFFTALLAEFLQGFQRFARNVVSAAGFPFLHDIPLDRMLRVQDLEDFLEVVALEGLLLVRLEVDRSPVPATTGK